MSRLYDTVEPSVIDEEMLQQTVEEQGPKEEAGKIAKEEGIAFKDVTALRLDFKNILKIDNLWCFVNLVKLQLDNNIIEKIEGLDTLTNLVWLDLSFNNIEVIEGLDCLTKLEDLTLYNNRIGRIENMDSLTCLHVLSIGNNDLKQLDNLVYLRNFKSLQTLNLGGNPLCELDEYKQFVIAHLPRLEYLDYRLVDVASKQAANEEYEIAIQEIVHDETQIERKALEESTLDQKLQLHLEAHVENLDGTQLFEELYAEDSEGQKLNSMPGVDELIVVYKEKFSGFCIQMFELGLEKHEERKHDLEMFWECFNEAKEDNKKEATEKIRTFMDFKKQLWVEISRTSDTAHIEKRLDEYNSEVSVLWDTLMGLEMQLVDQLEDAIKDFERNMADMVSAFIENIQGLMSQCRDLENQHHEKMLEIAMVTLEKVVKSELDEDIADDLRELFVDKDTIINAVQTSHDVHLLKIDNREDDLIRKINSWMTNLIENIHETEEVERNRMRVIEINNLIDHLRDEGESLDLQATNY